MPNFPVVNNPAFNVWQRVGQRKVRPTAVKGRQIAQTTMGNTTVERVTTNVADGSYVTLTSTITSSLDPGMRVGILPFQIAIYIGTATAATQLPFGASVAFGDYDLYGPVAMPNVTEIGTDGNNVVVKTYVGNNSGGAVDVIMDVNARILTARGASA